MPFDAAGFTDRPPPPSPRRPRAESVLLWLVGALALAFLLLPVSISGFADIVRYLQAR